MTDDTVTSVDTDDSLEAFEAEFYSTAHSKVDDEPAEEVEDANLGDNPSPPEEDEAEPESEPEAEPEEEAEEEDEEEDESENDKPRKNKVPFNKRIEQLNKQVRETERENHALLKRLEQLEAAITEKAKEEQTPLRDQLPSKAPNPDALGEDGEPIYPQGEFDPKYLSDLTNFYVDERMKEAEAKRAEEAKEKQILQEREALASQWNERLDKYEEEVPEVRENIRELTEVFKDLDTGYGEFLAGTLMSMDNGPQIMNYLSQNIGEAQKIVNSGPALAAIAFGRLDAILSPKPEAEKKEKKLSKAPPPPEDRTRGRDGKFAVAIDTDNLDAFEKEFFS